jgi:hypothetical protein
LSFAASVLNSANCQSLGKPGLHVPENFALPALAGRRSEFCKPQPWLAIGFTRKAGVRFRQRAATHEFFPTQGLLAKKGEPL